MEFEKRPEPDAAGRRAPRGGPVCAVLLAAVIGPAAVFAVVRSAGLDRGFVLVWAMAALPYLVRSWSWRRPRPCCCAVGGRRSAPG